MTLFQAFGQFAGQAAVAGAPGMVLIKPTSISHTGTSATLGANGQVTFSAVTVLSLNGCFTADFDNYVIYSRYYASVSDCVVFYRLRAAGSDASGASDYVQQRLFAQSTTVNGGKTTTSKGWFGSTSSENRSGDVTFFYGPFLAQPTASRNNGIMGQDGSRLIDVAGTHSLSTSYDGFTLLPDSTYSITGALQVYGVRS